jgi:opacity protein-like surface antigen
MHKIILSTLLLTSLSFADKSYSFFGAQTSFINYDNISSPSLGLKYGIQKGMWRTGINLDYATTGSNKLSSLMLQVDKGVLKNITKNSAFKPHIGFSLGVLQHKNSVTDKGYGIGLNTGATYLLNDTIDLDLSYRFLSTSKMNDIGSLNSLNLSLHYFY